MEHESSDSETETEFVDCKEQCQYSKCFYSPKYNPLESPNDDPDEHLVNCMWCRIYFCTTCFRKKRHERHKNYLKAVSSVFKFSQSEWNSLVATTYSKK